MDIPSAVNALLGTIVMAQHSEHWEAFIDEALHYVLDRIRTAVNPS